MVIIYLLFGFLVLLTVALILSNKLARNDATAQAAEEVEDVRAELEAKKLRELAAEMRSRMPPIQGECVESTDAQPKPKVIP
jgi:hypothetical protein